VYSYSLSNVTGVSRRSRDQRTRRAAILNSRLTNLRGRNGIASGWSGASTLPAIGDAHETYVLFGSLAELAQDGVDACAPAEPTKTVRATLAGITPGQYAVVSLGDGEQIFDGATFTNPVMLHDVLPGPQDLVASGIATPGLAPDKLIVFRNLNVPDLGSLPSPIDFNGPASLVPATATATITGASPADRLEIFVGLHTANGGGLLSRRAPPPRDRGQAWRTPI
jgi:hypothetical protein